jgi:hypothetical protein
VRAAELGHGVVAVAEEDALVELRGAAALGAFPHVPLRGGLRELVEEQAPQRALVARVAREEGALDRLREVDQREDRTIEVRDVGREAGALGFGEGLDRVLQGTRDASARLGGHPTPALAPLSTGFIGIS